MQHDRITRGSPRSSRTSCADEVITTSKPIKDVATAYGVGPETLRNWLNKYREANGRDGGADGLGAGPAEGARA